MTDAKRVMLGVLANHMSIEQERAGKHFAIQHDLDAALAAAGLVLVREEDAAALEVLKRAAMVEAANGE
jgi:hypothetical protein